MLPYLQEVRNKSKKYSVVFKGINYGEGTQDGEFAETYNLSTDQYPCITQRAERIKAGDYDKPYINSQTYASVTPAAVHAKGDLLVITQMVDPGGHPCGRYDVYYGGKVVGRLDKRGKKQIATIGNYIVIFPDKKYYKVPAEDENGVMQDGEFGRMEEIYTGSALSFTQSSVSRIAFPFKEGDEIAISGCSKNDGNNKEEVIVVKSATSDELTFADNTFAIATESGEVTIKCPGLVYTALYASFTTSSIKRSTNYNDEPFPFKDGDVITISTFSNKENDKANVAIKKVTDNELTFDEDTFSKNFVDEKVIITRQEKVYKASGLSFKPSKISKAGGFPFKKGDAVTITGCSKSENNKTAEIIIRAVTADTLTFDDNTFTAVESESNEVTISRTVPDLDFICESNYRLWGTRGNTIYSSKYSDPFNFQVFDGLASDSYAIEVGSEGDFTGCIPYSSHICFFKENTLHKLYGTKPSNFQITTANVYGVQSGSEGSMQIVNEQLLYKGVGGVYAYTGGVPELISEKFGNKRYSDAVACCDGEKYYISMKQGDNYHMFTYDVAKNIWLREDDTHAVDMTFYDGKVYYLDANGGLYYIDKEADRSGIEWSATFCTMHETVSERKGYSKFHLRMDLSAGAWLAVDIKTDNDLKWRQVYTTHNEKAKTVSIPIMPTRCDSIDIRLRGKGKCTIKAFIREFTVGSDV